MSVIIIHGTIARELEHHLVLEKQGKLTKTAHKFEDKTSPIKGKNKLTASLIDKL